MCGDLGLGFGSFGRVLIYHAQSLAPTSNPVENCVWWCMSLRTWEGRGRRIRSSSQECLHSEFESSLQYMKSFHKKKEIINK